MAETFNGISEILKQFKPTQRLMVLIFVLLMSVGGYVMGSYFKTDDCRIVVEENLKLHEALVKVSQIARTYYVEPIRVEPLMAEISTDSTSNPSSSEVIEVQSSISYMVDPMAQMAKDILEITKKATKE